MTKSNVVFSGSLSEVGRQQSLLLPGFVGFMRRLGFTAALTAGTGIAALGYAYAEAHFPALRRYRIEVPARSGFTGLRILHISDLHMFPGQRFITEFLKHVATEEDFDFVVSTGDNLGDKNSIDLLLEAYQPLLEFPGAFVLGSNDYYSPETKSWLSYLGRSRHDDPHRHQRRTSPDLPWLTLVNHLNEAGWLDLSNRTDSVTIGDTHVALIGVDDPHIRRDRVPPVDQTWQDPHALRLGLTHAPYQRILNSFTGVGADLILAGHTHGGQLRVPGYGALVTNCDLPQRYSRGMHRWYGQATDSYLHVSAGLGTSPYAPIRFSCRPEASLIDIVPA